MNINAEVAGMPVWVWGVAIAGGLVVVYVLPKLTGQGGTTATAEDQAAIDPITPGSGWVVLPASDTPVTQPAVLPTVDPGFTPVDPGLTVPPVVPPVKPVVTPPATSKTYTVVAGDSLWKIATRFLGSGTLWPTIYTANRTAVGSNPSLIHPGLVLTIPGR